jgi:hypothetical protein
MEVIFPTKLKTNIYRDVDICHCRLLLTSLGIFVNNNENDCYVTTE